MSFYLVYNLLLLQFVLGASLTPPDYSAAAPSFFFDELADLLDHVTSYSSVVIMDDINLCIRYSMCDLISDVISS